METYTIRARISEQTALHSVRESTGGSEKWLGICIDWIRCAPIETFCLFDALDQKIQEGDKPKPVPGLDRGIVETRRKDHPQKAGRPI